MVGYPYLVKEITGLNFHFMNSPSGLIIPYSE